MNKAQWLMQSEIGPLYLVASSEGLHGVHWKKQNIPLADDLTGPAKELQILAATVRQLEEYLSGRRRAFDLPLAAAGTAFQQRVWAELSKIPFGETRSYSDVAAAIRNQKAIRAVGTANGRNPLSIIVPCHRVIAADGTLGGYAGGLTVKTRLLQLEGRKI